MLLFEKIKTRITTNTKNSLTFLKYFLSNSSAKNHTNQTHKIVYIDINEPKLERYFFLLLKFFELTDFQINLKFNPQLLLNLRNYSDLIYTLKNFKIVLSPPARYDLWLTMKGKSDRTKNILSVDANYFSKKKPENSYIFPYNMHPDIYNSELYKTITHLRQTRKSIKVFFGGNTGYGYGNPDIKKLFGKITRNELISYIEAFANEKKLNNEITDQNPGVVFSEKPIDILIVKKPVFSLKEWMTALAQSNFYIAAPGFSMPFSHNAIESMSVGTIPILQYPEMFNPLLTDMVNCLKFDNETDLTEKINLALSLDKEKLAFMRTEVLNYYDQNLDPKAAIGNLIAKLPETEKMYINAEHLSIIELKKEMT